MARIRYLKPEFFEDEDIASLAYQERLFYAGLWCHADKAGRLEDRPKRLKAVIFPYDNIDPEKILIRLSRNKTSGRPFIQRYEIEGEKYIQILQWDKHQHPHHTEKNSEIPPAPPIKYKDKDKDKDKVEEPSTPLSNGYLTVKEEKPNDNIHLAIISYLNQKTSRNFKTTPQNIKLINSRLKEGFTKKNFLTVIDNQTEKWLSDEKMRDYLRPITLFSNKFESYLNTPAMTWQEKVKNA